MDSFSKEHTACVKGIAILILCAHHLFWHNVNLPMNLSEASGMDVLTVITKVCVATFTLLSGYGLNESYRRKQGSVWNFSFRHAFNLLKNYWWVYIPAFVMSFRFHVQGTPWEIYGTGWEGIRNFLLDFFGFRAMIYSPTLNNTWWYIETALVFYLLFPLFRFLMEKMPVVLLALVSIPTVTASVGIFWAPLITTDRELFYAMPFVLGMFFSEYGTLNNIVKKSGERPVQFGLGSLMFLGLCALLRTYMPLITDVLYSVAVVMCGIALLHVKKGRPYRVFTGLGKLSMDIYLIHSFVYFYFLPGRQLMASVENKFIRYLLFMLINVVIGFILSVVKEGVKKIIAGLRSGGRE